MTKAELKQFQVEVSKMPAGRYKTLMLEVARLAVIGWEVESSAQPIPDGGYAALNSLAPAGQDVLVDAALAAQK